SQHYSHTHQGQIAYDFHGKLLISLQSPVLSHQSPTVKWLLRTEDWLLATDLSRKAITESILLRAAYCPHPGRNDLNILMQTTHPIFLSLRRIESGRLGCKHAINGYGP